MINVELTLRDAPLSGIPGTNKLAPPFRSGESIPPPGASTPSPSI